MSHQPLNRPWLVRAHWNLIFLEIKGLACASWSIADMFDKAVAQHRASGKPSITREEADRRADAAVRNALAKMGIASS